MGGSAVCLSLLLITSLVISEVSSNAQLSKEPFYSTIPGDFCSTRSDPCCDLRQDDCAVPILGTLCYCDEFCNRVVNPDCCPDYSKVCLGYIPTPPPNDCLLNGRIFDYGESIQDNCNTCTCQNSGAVSCSNLRCLIEPKMLVNLQYNRDWVASNYSMFWGRRLDEGMLLRTGTKKPAYKANKNPVPLQYDPSDIPIQFDSRAKWPGLIAAAPDQGWCASSWAFSTSTVASDRFSIHSDGQQKVVLSPQNLVDCDTVEEGCQGGRLQRAWNYLRRFGVVNEMCYPYNSGSTETQGTCRIRRGQNLATFRCAGNPQLTVGRRSLYKTQPAHRIKSSEGDIQFEIMTDGPVQAVMRVHQDFFLYRSGVYSYSGPFNAKVEFHSVRLIGWGEEVTPQGNVLKYWLAFNSWGPEWGENGLFRILRGINESGIEEHILSVRPHLGFTPRRRRRRRRHHNNRRHEANEIKRRQ